MTASRNVAAYCIGAVVALVVLLGVQWRINVAAEARADRWEARATVAEAGLSRLEDMCGSHPDGSGTCSAGAFLVPSTTTTSTP